MSLSHLPKIVTNGLVLCLDASDIKSYPKSGTTWFDRSGNGHNGTLVGGVAHNSSNGGIFNFDGSNDGIVIPSHSDFLFNTGDSITVELWVKPTNASFQTYQTMFCIGGINAVTRDRMFQVRISNAYRFGCIYRDSSNTEWQILETSPTIVQNGKWHHVVSTLTYGTGSSWKIYVNGIGVTTFYLSGNGNANPIQPADTSVYIGLGEDGTNVAEQWLGSISQSRLYNRSLSAIEVQQNFNATRGRYGI